MRLSSERTELLARFLLKHWEESGNISLLKDRETVIRKIIALLQENMDQEEQLNADAKKLLDQNRRKVASNIDEEQMLQMIRKQLAKERGFVL